MIFTDESYKRLEDRLNGLKTIEDYSEGIPTGTVIFSKQYQEYIVVARSDTAFTECILLKRSPNWRTANYSALKFPTQFLVGDDYKGKSQFFMCNYEVGLAPEFTNLSVIMLDHIGTEGLAVLTSQFNIFIKNGHNDIKDCVAVVEVCESLVTNIENKSSFHKTTVRFVKCEKKFLRKETMVREEMEIKAFFKEYTMVGNGLVGW